MGISFYYEAMTVRFMLEKLEEVRLRAELKMMTSPIGQFKVALEIHLRLILHLL